MIRLHVWVTLPAGETLLAGEIVTTDPDERRGGRLDGAFRYTPDYLKDRRAFALDPVRLPLEAREFGANRPDAGVHAVFEDSLPDAWGRRVMIRRFQLPRREQRVPQLLSRTGANALGALSYSETETPRPSDPPASRPDLKTLVDAALRFDAGEVTDDDDLALMFQACSSPGGARPKALLRDDGIDWIAKFPSLRDTFAMVPLEAATLTLARNAGVIVPETRIVRAGKRPVLLVRRFDVSNAGGRHHTLSMQTLLGAEGHYFATYAQIADALQRWSDHDDVATLFRLMVFNVAIGNTDDHLKNFSMLRDERGWRLAPAYDLLPNWTGNAEHQLGFGATSFPPDRNELADLGKRFGVKPRQVTSIINDVRTACGAWETAFKDHDVPRADIERVRADINRRADGLSKK